MGRMVGGWGRNINPDGLGEDKSKEKNAYDNDDASEKARNKIFAANHRRILPQGDLQQTDPLIAQSNSLFPPVAYVFPLS